MWLLANRKFCGRKGIYPVTDEFFTADALIGSLSGAAFRNRGRPSSKESTQRKARVSSHEIAARDVSHT